MWRKKSRFGLFGNLLYHFSKAWDLAKVIGQKSKAKIILLPANLRLTSYPIKQ